RLRDDVVEDRTPVWGYDKLPPTLPASVVAVVRYPATLGLARTGRRALVGAGLAEAIAHAFSDPARAALLRAPGAPEPLRLLNPLSQDASLLRIHPLEGVLAAVAVNVRRQQPDVGVFEICKTYEADTGETGAREPRWVAIALTGARADHAW